MSTRAARPSTSAARAALRPQHVAADPAGERAPGGPVARLDALFGAAWTARGDDSPGVTWGVGLIDGIRCVGFATDPTVRGGALTAAVCDQILAAYDRATALAAPIVGLWQSGGAHVGEGVESLHGVGRVMAAMTHASGRVPQLSVVLGPAAGGAAYGPALTDIVILGPAGRVFVTGPDVVRSVTGECVDMLGLGGPHVHSRQSGLAHVIADTDERAIGTARELVGLLGAAGSAADVTVEDRDLGRLLPESSRRAYDVHPVVEALLDGPGIEFQRDWARNIVTTMGRLGERTVGVVASNPLHLAGCLTADAADKASRFVRMCDAFGVPLVVLVDVPGYLPGAKQEWGGLVRRGAKLLHAFAEAAVPRVTVVLRKAYGGAYIAMNSRALGADRVLAWPDAEIAVMGPVAAVRVLHRRRLEALTFGEREQAEAELAATHAATVGGVHRAVELGLVDQVVAARSTRSAVAAALHEISPRRGSHANLPL